VHPAADPSPFGLLGASMGQLVWRALAVRRRECVLRVPVSLRYDALYRIARWYRKRMIVRIGLAESI
jgi:hypothetical protein